MAKTGAILWDNAVFTSNSIRSVGGWWLNVWPQKTALLLEAKFVPECPLPGGKLGPWLQIGLNSWSRYRHAFMQVNRGTAVCPWRAAGVEGRRNPPPSCCFQDLFQVPVSGAGPQVSPPHPHLALSTASQSLMAKRCAYSHVYKLRS